jgi:Fic family protein
MAELVQLWPRSLVEAWAPPLIALAAFNLDFLCIHPFRDGNGRVSRLLLLLQTYQLGFAVGRYISLERLIEANEERYYETLEESSHGRREDTHDPWPYANYLLFTLRLAYQELESRLTAAAPGRGAKTRLVLAAIDGQRADFTISDLEVACPSVSRETIRRVLRDLKRAGKVEVIGRGPGARWRRRRGHEEPERGSEKG